MTESNSISFGIALPQVFYPGSVDMSLVGSFVTRAEALGFESLWVQVVGVSLSRWFFSFQDMTRWEYRVEFPNISGPDSDTFPRLFGNFGWLFNHNIIDQLDADGWELVTIARASGERPTLVFKRLKP